jgi:uncharacterized protein
LTPKITIDTFVNVLDKSNYMTFNNLFQFLVPKDRQFFPLFKTSSQNLIALSQAVKELTLADVAKRDELFNKIKTLKVVNEETTHQINLELSKSYLTPFDREDIFMLANSIDSIVSNLFASASRIQRYKIVELNGPIKELAAINLEACLNLDPAISGLEKKIMIKDIISKTNILEDKADDIYNAAIDHLFETVSDAKEIIKQKEILKALEKVSDQCKEVAKVIEMIVVKHS